MATKLKFNNKAIEALPLPADGQRTEYADTETVGLRLRVTSNGAKTFSLLRRIKNGPMERVTLGRYPDIKTEAARTKAQQLIGAIVGGANPAELKRLHKGEMTFGQLFDEYLARHSKPRKRSWQEDERNYQKHLEKKLARKKLSKITRQDIAGIHGDITRDGFPIAANRTKELVSSMFSKAIAWGYADVNPATGIEDNPEKSRERFLKPGELPALFEAIGKEPNESFRDFFLLAMLTGARRGNVRSMRWVDIDFDAALWVVPGAMSKNGKPLDIPLVPEALEILARRKQQAADKAVFVFPASRSDSTLGHMSGERKGWLRILAAAGLSNVRIHDLRRTLGSWQARTGASLLLIGKTLGHQSHEATKVYARLDVDPVRAAMNTATSAMLEAGGVKKSAEVVPMKRGKRSKTAA